ARDGGKRRTRRAGRGQRRGGGGGGSRGRCHDAGLELERTDVANGHPITVSIHRPHDTPLIRGRRRAVAAPGVDRRAAGRQGVGEGRAAVVRQWTEVGGRVDEVTGIGEAAGVPAVEVVVLG